MADGYGVSMSASGTPWHAFETEAIGEALGVAIDFEHGLDESDAARRLAEDGPNAISLRPPPSFWRRLLGQLSAPLVAVLLVAAVGAFLLGESIDGAVILAVVGVNAVVGLVQEGKAIAAIESLTRSLRVDAMVRRDGRWRRIDSESLVRGDLVRLESGDRVPADLRLVQVRGLSIDESMLTGESVPVAKDVAAVAEASPLAERSSQAFAGTLVARGRAAGVVVAIGDASEMGRLGGMLAAAGDFSTPLVRKMRTLSRLLVWVILAIAGLAFLVGWLQGRPASEMFMAAVALAVAAIPEGLPAGLTIILAIGVARMARRRAIVRSLPSVETLGSTTVICTDKTGTLTRNEMTVTRIVAGGRRYRIEGVGYEPRGAVVDAAGDEPAAMSASPALERLLEAATLCNDAHLVEREGVWAIEGDPTEAALLVAARKAGLDLDAIESRRPRVATIEFESERRFMATRHAGDAKQAATIVVKGAAETVLARCDRALDPRGDVLPLDAEAVHREIHRLAGEGLRVLAIAEASGAPDAAATPGTDFDAASIGESLVLLGLVGMLDPPREEAAAAVAACRGAGIRVKMVTGDHAATAAEVAAAVGIGVELGGSLDDRAERPRTLSGAAIDRLDDEALAERLAHVDVLARVSPEQKLRIVRALQANGEVVAMTGDGVNDAPALRQADIGIAMGQSGTEAAKESADLVLADDRFATIAHAVEEGRGVFGTLRMFIVWTLPTNGGEGFVILASILSGGPLPLLPVQALWVNMTTSVLLGVPLAFEPHEPGAMHRPPRDPKRPLLDFELLMRIGLVSILLWIAATGLFHLELARGRGEASGRAAAATAHVIGEAFYLFASRGGIRPFWSVPLFANGWLWAGLATMLLAQVAFVSLPPMQAVFGTAPLDAIGWGLAALAGTVILAAVEIEKAVRRRLGGVGGSD